jgi:hypothetical protein
MDCALENGSEQLSQVETPFGSRNLPVGEPGKECTLQPCSDLRTVVLELQCLNAELQSCSALSPLLKPGVPAHTRAALLLA